MAPVIAIGLGSGLVSIRSCGWDFMRDLLWFYGAAWLIKCLLAY
jgi:hypothetical protein